MKALDVGDVIALLDDVIDDWGPQAKGGDVFDSENLIEDAKFANAVHYLEPNQVKLIGFTADEKLPVCLVGTLASDLGVKDSLTGSGIAYERGLTEDAEMFLDHVVSAVDGVEYEGLWGSGTTKYPANPKRDWRLALDRVLDAWGLA